MEAFDNIKFDEDGLIPAIIQDWNNDCVLMLAFMNQEALSRTLQTGYTHFWSRSRNSLWFKGETSGNTQKVKEIFYDCDGDALLIKVEQKGSACHTGQRSCFFNNLIGYPPSKSDDAKRNLSSIMNEIYDVILDRRHNPRENSYVSSLFREGLNKILKKIGEEAAEVMLSGREGIEEHIIHEIADLFFHCLVLLGFYQISPDRIYEELRRRFGKSGMEEKRSRQS